LKNIWNEEGSYGRRGENCKLRGFITSSISRMIRSRRMRSTRRGEHMKEKEKCMKARKNTKTRPRREDNINMDLIWDGLFWIGLD
jgi:hypothetical protein